MDIHGFSKAAWAFAARLRAMGIAAFSKATASSHVLEQMQQVYQELQEKPISTVEELLDYQRRTHHVIPYNSGPNNEDVEFSEAEFYERIKRPFYLAAAMQAASGMQIVYSMTMRRIEDEPHITNPSIYSITGKDGQRISYDDLKRMGEAREAKVRSIYLFNMVKSLSRLDYYERTAIRDPDSKYDFEAGESNYAYGIRMIINEIIFHALDKKTGEFLRDKLIEDAGLKGNVKDSAIKQIMDDVEEGIWLRYETGKVMRPRHHHLTLVKSDKARPVLGK